MSVKYLCDICGGEATESNRNPVEINESTVINGRAMSHRVKVRIAVEGETAQDMCFKCARSAVLTVFGANYGPVEPREAQP